MTMTLTTTMAAERSMPPDENVGPTLLIISCVLLALIIATTGLRVYTRYSLRRLGWDDYTMAACAALATVRVGVQIAQVAHGNGRHRDYLRPADYTYVNMLGWYAQILLFASTPLLKISICLFILRIRDSKWLARSLYIVIGGLIVTNLACIIILLAECSPVQAYWEGGGVCWDTRVRIYSIYLTIAYSLLTDLICSLLPLVVIWKVQMPVRTKLMVWGLMSMGLIATSFGALRASSLGLVTSDLSWSYAIAAIWSNLELFLGIIAANLALFRSVWVFLRHGKSGDTSYARSASAGGSGHLSAFGSRDARSELRSEVRRPSVPHHGNSGRSRASQGSDIPLDTHPKKAQYWTTEEDTDEGRDADSLEKLPRMDV